MIRALLLTSLSWVAAPAAPFPEPGRCVAGPGSGSAMEWGAEGWADESEGTADDGAEDQDPFSPRLEDDPIHRARRRAELLVEKGLLHLSMRLGQGQGGGLPSVSGPDPVVAKMALTALAYMAYGTTTENCQFSMELRSCIRWLLAHTKEVPSTAGVSPAPLVLYFFDPRDNHSKMHGHGYATWAVALAYGMTMNGNPGDRRRLREVVEGAVRCIEQAQTESGGWGYEYERGTFHEGSMTVTQLQALRAARDAGIHVDSEVIDAAIRYLRQSQVREGPRQGAFRYKLGDRNTSFALTAAAVSSLNQIGLYDDPDIDAGLESMRQTDPLINQKNEDFPWYSRLYASQAYWQYRNLEPFRRFYPILVERIAGNLQGNDGAFGGDSEYGTDYTTALGSLALCVPFGYLPSFQR